MIALPSSLMTPQLIEAFDVAGPRYTSYPTADRFVDAFGSDDFVLALKQRKSGMGSSATPLSLYVHIPFCESLCYYCACNKIVTKHKDKAQIYLRYLDKEMALIAAHLGTGKLVSQLHLGGGSPTFLTDAELTQLLGLIEKYFRLMPTSECSIEIDPRTVDAARLSHIWQLGFNRLSFGVQDFDGAVQKVVHRVQSFESVASLMQTARGLGFASQNVDLIYGLPKQNLPSFVRTIEQVIALAPERIALYAYAHLPERFKPQRRIHGDQLPDAASKVAMHSHAITRLMQAGYEYIGMDHFALPHDDLAKAKRNGLLHRNFQGYSTQSACDMLGIGVSAISKMGSTYSQNAKTLAEYYDALDCHTLAVCKGLSLTPDDVVRRSVIMSIMCQGRVDFEAIELAHLLDFSGYFARELEQLRPLETNGMVRLGARHLEVTELGWFFVRAVAMVFDKYWQASRARATFSKII